jgi:hypothetical protein
MVTGDRLTGTVGYNVQTATETEHHLIVAHEVTNHVGDRGQGSERLAYPSDAERRHYPEDVDFGKTEHLLGFGGHLGQLLGQIVEANCNIRVIGAEAFLSDGERAAHDQFRFWKAIE